MAELYHATVREPSGDRSVAIKRILPNYAANPEFRKMFEYEAHLSQILKHPNIVQTFDFTELGATYLLEMEFIHGVNLKQLTSRLKEAGERLTVQWAVYFIQEVCAGLEYAHTRNDDKNGTPFHIIHRDMSPQNIMISFDGNVKIVDFGIAKARTEADHTQTGVIKGKFAYMSPEQASGEEVDERTDIFSAGISLWELLTGERLFARDNDLATLREVLQGTIRKPSELNPDVPAALDSIVLKALARNKNDRYQTAGQLSEDLKKFLKSYSPDFAPSHLTSHLARLYAKFLHPEPSKANGTVLNPTDFPKEYWGDVFYEASESSITHLPQSVGDEEPIENSFTELKPKTDVIVVSPAVEREEQNLNIFSILGPVFGVITIITAVFYLQDLKPLEKPTAQASFSSRALSSLADHELAQLKIMVNKDVELYVKRVKIGDAKAFIPVTLNLKGDQRHRIEFREKEKKQSTSRVVLVKSGYINRLDVNIE